MNCFCEDYQEYQECTSSASLKTNFWPCLNTSLMRKPPSELHSLKTTILECYQSSDWKAWGRGNSLGGRSICVQVYFSLFFISLLFDSNDALLWIFLCVQICFAENNMDCQRTSLLGFKASNLEYSLKANLKHFSELYLSIWHMESVQNHFNMKRLSDCKIKKLKSHPGPLVHLYYHF